MDLYIHRIMSRDQIIALGYFKSVGRCNSRLRQLFDCGFVRRVFPQNGRYGAQALHAVNRAAVGILIARIGADEPDVANQVRREVAPMFLEHTLAIVDCRIRLEHEAPNIGARVELWLPELLCRHEYSVRDGDGQRWQKRVLKPDAFVQLRSQGVARCFFLEVDMGHVSLGRFERKISTYSEYVRLGLFKDAYDEHGFTVLTVTTGRRRLSNLKSLVSQAEHPRFLFTTFESLDEGSIFDCVWQGERGMVSLIGGAE
ncbi:MAG: replication-relaxation family protein [bacterium]|nr:replication-relaxation family protein [bacterium]